MTQIVLREVDKSAFEQAFEKCRNWSRDHQAEIGVAEMAIGAAILSWGVMNGHIQMGTDVVGSKLADVGGLAGFGVGGIGSKAIAATYLKGLFVGGVTTIAGVTAVPAVVLIGGGALIFSAFGYVIGDKLEAIINPAPGFGDFLKDASIVAVGVALMIDGARRIIKDERVLAAASKFKDGVIELVPKATKIVATGWDELQAFANELAKSHSGQATAATAAAAGAGAATGASLAAGTVSVLGSHSLGAIALSLGLVSAPVWPMIAGGAAGLAIGVAVWKGVRNPRFKSG